LYQKGLTSNYLKLLVEKIVMKIKELRQKSEKELKGLLDENRHRLGQLKFDLASKKLKNHREIRELRKNIARILTLSSERKNEPEK